MMKSYIAFLVLAISGAVFADEPDVRPTEAESLETIAAEEARTAKVFKEEVEPRARARSASRERKFRNRKNRMCTLGGGCVELTGDDLVIPRSAPKQICESEKAESIESEAFSANTGEFTLRFKVIEAAIEGVSSRDPGHAQQHFVRTRCTIETELGEESVLLPGGRLPDGAFDATCNTPQICVPGRSYVARVAVSDDGEMWILDQSSADVTACRSKK